MQNNCMPLPSSKFLSIVSIRAYGAQDAFRKESYLRLDKYTRAQITYWNLNRYDIFAAVAAGWGTPGALDHIYWSCVDVPIMSSICKAILLIFILAYKTN